MKVYVRFVKQVGDGIEMVQSAGMQSEILPRTNEYIIFPDGTGYHVVKVSWRYALNMDGCFAANFVEVQVS